MPISGGFFISKMRIWSLHVFLICFPNRLILFLTHSSIFLGLKLIGIFSECCVFPSYFVETFTANCSIFWRCWFLSNIALIICFKSCFQSAVLWDSWEHHFYILSSLGLCWSTGIYFYTLLKVEQYLIFFSNHDTGKCLVISLINLVYASINKFSF